VVDSRGISRAGRVNLHEKYKYPESLFVNTGHGHLGWTLAAGSGQLIANLVAGRVCSINPGDYAPDRF
jgi:glycine/D-amino acid oxidase-like deaminating enzyme